MKCPYNLLFLNVRWSSHIRNGCVSLFCLPWYKDPYFLRVTCKDQYPISSKYSCLIHFITIILAGNFLRGYTGKEISILAASKINYSSGISIKTETKSKLDERPKVLADYYGLHIIRVIGFPAIQVRIYRKINVLIDIYRCVLLWFSDFSIFFVSFYADIAFTKYTRFHKI